MSSTPAYHSSVIPHARKPPHAPLALNLAVGNGAREFEARGEPVGAALVASEDKLALQGAARLDQGKTLHFAREKVLGRGHVENEELAWVVGRLF